jgi:hypothetical protein
MPHPPKAPAKVMLAIVAHKVELWRRILEGHELVSVMTLSEAMQRLAEEDDLRLVIIGVHFDESRMFTLLGDIRAQRHELSSDHPPHQFFTGMEQTEPAGKLVLILRGRQDSPGFLSREIFYLFQNLVRNLRSPVGKPFERILLGKLDELLTREREDLGLRWQGEKQNKA